MYWSSDKQVLFNLGAARVADFCEINNIVTPTMNVIAKKDWSFSVCAYYRKDTTNICLELCQSLCGETRTRNWTWPGSTTDREPYGVLAHELGHHVDVIASTKKGTYYGDFSHTVRKDSGEKAITSYCPNDAEWFAEMFRVFVTNPNLLSHIRPITYKILTDRWLPVQCGEWREELGMNVPVRVIKTLINKGAK